MKKIRKVLFIIIMLLINNAYVNAAVCDDDNIDKLKERASKVNITYEMDNDYVNENGEKEKGVYKIIVTGLEEYTSIRIRDLNINEKYTSDNQGNIIIKNVESGIKKVSIYFDICDALLITKTLNIPIFNKYSQREECNGITDLDVCMEDYKYQLNEGTFQKKIKEYKEAKEQEENEIKKESKISIFFNNFVEFLKNYYLYIIGIIVLVVSLTIYIVVKKKRYTLE